MPDDEFERVLGAAAIGIAFVLLAARDAALRAGTIYQLRARDIDGEYITTRTKGDTAVTVPISPRLRVLIDAAVQRVGDSDKPLIHALGVPESAYVSHYTTKWLKTLQKRVHSSTVWTWHDLRRTAAVRLYEAEHDLHLAQALLGHKSLHATMIYLRAMRKSITLDALAAYASGKEGTK